MDMNVTCPGCSKQYTMASSVAGKRARCKICRHEFMIPVLPDASTTHRPAELVDDASFVVEGPRGPARATRPAPSASATGAGQPFPPGAPPFPPGAPLDPPRQSRYKSSPTGPTTSDPRRLILAGALGGAGATFLLLIGVGWMFRTADREPAAEQPAPAVAQPAAPAEPKLDPGPNDPPGPTVAASETPPAHDLSTADLVARCEPSVALIKGRRGSGTGFLVRPDILATNAHVIDGETVQNLEVRFPSADGPSQGPLNARLIYQDPLRDLAFLAVATDLPPLTVAGGYTFRKGEDVTVIGNPGLGGQMVLENAISRGVVSSKTRLNGRDFLQLGISINPGNSGGPVLDATGTVIGVVTLKTTRQEGLAFCIPAEDLGAALAVAESRSGLVARGDGPPKSSPSKSTVTAKGSVPELSYGWKPGETYVYRVDVSINTGSHVVTLQGSSIYRVKSVDDEGITLGHRGWLVTRKRGQDGRTIPGGISGPPGGDREVELKIDRKGSVLNANGASPLPLLGDLSMLVIEPLPDGPHPSWEEGQAITLNEVQQVSGRRGARSGSAGPTWGACRGVAAPSSGQGSRAARDRGSVQGSRCRPHHHLRRSRSRPTPPRSNPAIRSAQRTVTRSRSRNGMR